MIWRAGFLQDGAFVEFRVRHGVVAAVKHLLVRLLLAVIRERLSGHLTPAQAAAVSKRRQKNCVDRALLLKEVKHGVHAFVRERHGAGLDADHFGRRGLFRGAGQGRKQRRDGGGGGGDAGGGLDEFSAGDGSVCFHKFFGSRKLQVKLTGTSPFLLRSAATRARCKNSSLGSSSLRYSCMFINYFRATGDNRYLTAVFFIFSKSSTKIP